MKQVSQIKQKFLLIHLKERLDQAQEDLLRLQGIAGLERDFYQARVKRDFYAMEYQELAEKLGVKHGY